MSLPLAGLSLAAQLSSVILQLLSKPPSPVVVAELAPIEPPITKPTVSLGSKGEYQIADFINANLQVLNGDIKASVPFPKGVRQADHELVKSFVKQLRSAAREIHINNTVSSDVAADPVIANTGTAPSSVIGLARELEGQIQKGNAAIRHGHESVRELRELLVESSSRLRRIRDHARAVRDGVELVKDLSDQTNVLALNAAIQASRSGEDGLGVVAEELQRVAVRGADSGRKLEEQLEALRDDLSDTMAAITRGEQGVSTTLKSHEAVQEAYSLVEKTSSEIAARAKSASA
jgi:twitching motility protein PilJ